MLYEKKIEHLRDYKGLAPKPADFDKYWDRALAELDKMPLDCEIIPYDYPVSYAKCYDVYFTGVGGAKIHCKMVTPSKIEGKIPGVAMFHGYSDFCGDWASKLCWAACGYAVLALDVRGQAGPSEDNFKTTGNTLNGHIIRGVDDEDIDNLYYRNVFLDTAQTARVLMNMDFVDETRVGATGFSQGGALTVACAALEPRVKVVQPSAAFLSDYSAIYQNGYHHGAYEEINTYFRTRDAMHQNEDNFFNKLAYIDIKNLADRIKGKVLWIMDLCDDICPPFSQFAAYNNIQSEKDIKFYPEFGHEWGPYQSDYQLKFFIENL